MSTQSDDPETGTYAGEASANEANPNGAGQTTKTLDDAGQELIDEFTHLGQKVVEVIEIAWKSDQRKKIEEDVRGGLVALAGALEDGFKRVSNTKEAHEAVNAAEDVAGKVKSSKIAVELSSALAQGLHLLSEQVDKLSNEMRQKAYSSPSNMGTGSNDDLQDIPIDLGTEG